MIIRHRESGPLGRNPEMLRRILHSVMSKTPDFFDGIASANFDIYNYLTSKTSERLAKFRNEDGKKEWSKIMVERLAEDLQWRLQHSYDHRSGMNRKQGNSYRNRAEQLLKRSQSSRNPIFNRECFDIADGLASTYLVAESLCSENPPPINFFMSKPHQHEILKDINSMLAEYSFKDVMCMGPFV
jgi:hypothetical protein